MRKVGIWIWEHWWRIGAMGLFWFFVVTLWTKSEYVGQDRLETTFTFVVLLGVPFLAGVEHTGNKL